MSMYNDIVWRVEGNTEKCFTNSFTIANYARRFPRGRWSLDLDPKRNGMERRLEKKTEEIMMLNLLSESRHSVFRASSAFERGELRSKGHGKKSFHFNDIHFNGSEENIELLLRMAISANLLSVYGAVADLCKDLSEDSSGSGET